MFLHDSQHWFVACAWLALLALGVLAYLAVQYARSPYSPWEIVLYIPTYLFGRLLWRVQFMNSPPAALQTGAVLVANHRSSVDPFFVQLSAGRRVHWMVAREYCESRIFGPILRAVQAIPTNRSGMDTGATKLAIRLAREGRLVGMFPEGRLNHTACDPLVSIRPGAALVAMRAGVPMIPLLIEGSPYRREVWSPLIMPAHVQITFGEPIDPSPPSEENVAVAQPDSLAATDTSSASATRDSSEREHQRRLEMIETERMMLAWGKQIVRMAGIPDWPIEIAGRSRLASNLKAPT